MTLADGKQILSGLREARKFFRSVSLLVQAADDLFADAGWEVLSSNKCTDLLSTVSNPNYWLPATIYRYYAAKKESNTKKDLVLFLSILLEPEKKWAGFNKPWITCGMLKFRSKQSAKQFNGWGWIEVHQESEKPADGTLNKYERTREDRKEEAPDLISYSTMALPLVSIQSAEHLEQRVIDPLLEEVKQSDIRI